MSWLLGLALFFYPALRPDTIFLPAPTTTDAAAEPVVYDVVIVGGGLVGATLACAIAGRRSMASARVAVLEYGSTAPLAPSLEK